MNKFQRGLFSAGCSALLAACSSEVSGPTEPAAAAGGNSGARCGKCQCPLGLAAGALRAAVDTLQDFG